MNLSEFAKSQNYQDGFELRNEDLELLKNELLALEEFKNVKTLNFLMFPCYMTDESGEPSINGTKTCCACTIQNLQEFKEKCDILSITFWKKYKYDNLEDGFYITPTNYSKDNFQPKREIKVIFSPEKLQDSILKEGGSSIWMDWLKNIEELLENNFINNSTNLPYDYDVLVRCSPRSITEQEAESDPNYLLNKQLNS